MAQKAAAEIMNSDIDSNQYAAEQQISIIIDRHFPAPAPEPAFDESAFWAMMPPWIMYRAMDEDGEYTVFREEPQCLTQDFARSWTQPSEFALPIPPEFAPPAVADWKLSLVKRPTPDQP